MKKASKQFASHFSCGSSVTGDDEIVVQGDVCDGVYDYILELWPEVGTPAIRTDAALCDSDTIGIRIRYNTFITVCCINAGEGFGNGNETFKNDGTSLFLGRLKRIVWK